MGQLGLFDLDERTAKLTEMGDPLVGLKEQINWEAFRPDLNRVHEKNRKSNAGAKPIDVVLMFKLLVLQQLHSLSDDRLEYQIRDRLKDLKWVEDLFARFHEQLAAQGYVARAGQMIDASFVEVPRERNSREDNAKIKAGETPEAWQTEAKKPLLRQKEDPDARWTQKHHQAYYGYKNHINADQGHKLVHSYQVTDAAVHDSQVFEELLDQSVDGTGKKRAVYADSAYRSQEQEDRLAAENLPSQICEEGARNHPLTDAQKASNKEKSKVRARVEHVFGAQAQMGGHLVRTIVRAHQHAAGAPKRLGVRGGVG